MKPLRFPPVTDGDSTHRVLRRYWHPVVTSEAVEDAPYPVRLLDTPLVLWRSDGRVVAFYDLCIHRGAPLSMGRVHERQLVCGFHGWHYGTDGKCTRIPALPALRAIPAKARAAAYRCEEKYGLIWVCLDEPLAAIPEFPEEFADPTYRWDRPMVEDVNGNAARFMENTMDLSHFAWVHAGVLASDEEVDPIVVEPLPDGFAYDIRLPTSQLDLVRSRYRLTLPFTLVISQYDPYSPKRQVLIFLCTPLSSRATKVIRLGGRNHTRMSDEEELERAQLVFRQDQTFVEAQRPEELPLDLRAELHVRGPDSAAVEYRRLLATMGVAWT